MSRRGVDEIIAASAARDRSAKRWRWFQRGLIATVVILLLAIWPARQWIGPTAAVPQRAPTYAWDAQYGPAGATAASVYRAAFEKWLEPPTPESLRCVDFESPLTDDVEAWLDEQDSFAEQIRAASLAGDCWFDYGDIGEFAPSASDMNALRAAAKLFRVRLVRAHFHRDLDAFTDDLLTLHRLSRAARPEAGLVPYLIRLAIRDIALRAAPRPLTWGALDAASRAHYFALVAEILEPPTGFATALAAESEWSKWHSTAPRYQNIPWWQAPRARVCGEIERVYLPAIRLAALPPAERRHAGAMDWAVVREYQGDDSKLSWGPVYWNGPYVFTTIVIPSLHRAFILEAQVETKRAGVHTLFEIVSFADRVGRLPTDLDELAGDCTFDPLADRALIYHLTADGFTLYSAGFDGDDDGGAHDNRFGERRDAQGKEIAPDGDYVFWPIPSATD